MLILLILRDLDMHYSLQLNIQLHNELYGNIAICLYDSHLNYKNAIQNDLNGNVDVTIPNLAQIQGIISSSTRIIHEEGSNQTGDHATPMN